jgi:hypothetical protein
MAEIRERKPTKPKETAPHSPAALAKAEDSSLTLLDAARGLVLLLLISTALSYFVTRESLVWNLSRPKFTRLDVIKTWIVCFPFAL